MRSSSPGHMHMTFACIRVSYLGLINHSYLVLDAHSLVLTSSLSVFLSGVIMRVTLRIHPCSARAAATVDLRGARAAARLPQTTRRSGFSAWIGDERLSTFVLSALGSRRARASCSASRRWMRGSRALPKGPLRCQRWLSRPVCLGPCMYLKQCRSQAEDMPE